ncbi:hypothetical protein BH10ACI1_BH10ACI1_30020 [soil metagenome]
MELINNFANISKNLSENFSLTKSEISLYLLALIQDNSQEPGPHLATFATNYNDLVEVGILDWDTFCSIKNSGLFDLEIFDKNQLSAFSEYLIKEYLESTEVLLPTTNFLTFIANLATESALELHSPNDYIPHLPPIIDPSESFNLNDRNDIGCLIALSVSRPNPNYRTDRNTNWCVYIANVGIGDIVVKLLENLGEKGISEHCSVVGDEPNKILNFLTDFNYFAHNINKNLQTNSENSLNSSSNQGFGLDYEVQIAISIPPFINIRQQDLQEFYEFVGSKEKIYFSELAYIELMLKRVSERGKIIAVVRNEFLFSKKSKIFREKYLRNDWIEKIIALPKEFVNYPIDISVIVFNKTKIEKGFVIFDGSEDKFEKTKINIEDIFSNEVDLRVGRYAAKENQEIESILSKYPQDEVKKIKDLIDASILGFNYSPKNRITENSPETLPYIRVKDLSNNDKDFTLDISKVERKISPEKITHKRTIIDYSAILVSKIAPKLKPTYFNFTGQRIVIGSDVIALKLKADINPEYFLTQLQSRLVQTQVEMMSSGNVINRIGKEDLLNIRIILPSLEEQQRQIFERRGVNEEKAIVQEQLSIAKEEIETTEYDVIAAIAHNLNQKLGQIVDDYRTLILFLENKEKNQLPIRFEETLRPVRNTELIENVPTFSKVVNRLQNNLLDTAYTMKTTENILQKSSVDAQKLDIIKFFKESIKVDFENPHFGIKIESKLKSLFVLADFNALKDAFRNLIENAKKHGFTQSELKYQIVFEISKFTDDLGDNFARIVYKNNGNPFPKSYRFEDYIRLGTRMGKNKGTGIGGFFVKKVVELHGGSFKEITLHENNQETFQVQMEILLPVAD